MFRLDICPRITGTWLRPHPPATASADAKSCISALPGSSTLGAWAGFSDHSQVRKRSWRRPLSMTPLVCRRGPLLSQPRPIHWLCRQRIPHVGQQLGGPLESRDHRPVYRGSVGLGVRSSTSSMAPRTRPPTLRYDGHIVSQDLRTSALPVQAEEIGGKDSTNPNFEQGRVSRKGSTWPMKAWTGAPMMPARSEADALIWQRAASNTLPRCRIATSTDNRR